MRFKTILGCDKFMIQFMRGSSSQVQSDNPVLAAGQPFYETDTHKMKVGDGSTVYVDLPYIGDGLAAQYKLDRPFEFSAVGKANQIELSWESPPDKYSCNLGQTASDSMEPTAIWDHDVVRRKEGSAPTSISDGEHGFESTIRHTSVQVESDTSSVNGTDYYYGVWSVATNGAVSDGATFGPVASFDKPNLDDYTWQQLKDMRIAGTAATTFALGDSKTVHIQGTIGTTDFDVDLRVFIIDFSHNASKEGAGMVFQGFKNLNDEFVGLVDQYYGEDGTASEPLRFNMNPGYSTDWNNSITQLNGGWQRCRMRYSILGSTNVQNGNATSTCLSSPVSNTLMAALPEDLRDVMEPFTVWSCNAANMATDNPSSSYTTDYLPLIDEYEMLGQIQEADEETMGGGAPSTLTNQVQYTFWRNSGYIRPLRFDTGVAGEAFFRSPHRRTTNITEQWYYLSWGGMGDPKYMTPGYAVIRPCESSGVCPLIKI